MGTARRGLSIASRLLAWFLVMALLPLAVVTVVTYVVSQRVLKQEISNQVQTLADSKGNQIEDYVDRRRKETYLLTQTMFVLEGLTRAKRAATIDEADTAARPLFENYAREAGYLDLLLFQPDGKLLFSVDRHPGRFANFTTDPRYHHTQLGKTFDRARMFMEIEFSGYEQRSSEGPRIAYVAAPILREGKVLGVIALGLASVQVERIVHDYTGLGDTGETLLAAFDGEGMTFITESRSTPPADFTGRVVIGSANAVSLQNAVLGMRGHGRVQDYRGVPVVAAWRYLPSRRWGMVVKIDEAEAYAPAYQLSQTLIALMAFTLLAVVVVALLVARSLSDPVVAMTRVAQLVSAGDLDQRITDTGRDEIGDLARAFNKMTADLKETYAKIEDKVKQRTRDLEASEQRIRSLMSCSAEAIYGTDLKGNCTFCNPACLHMIACESEDKVLGKNMHALIHHTRADGTPHPVEVCRIYQAFQLGEGTHVDDEVFWRLDGTAFPVEYRSHPVRVNGEVVGAVVNFQDISERLKAQESLRLAKTAAEEANRAKSQFLANMSHELRTPLNAIIGYSEMLQEEATDLGQEDFIPDLQKIHTSGKHLLELINAVLDLSKIEAGKMELFLETFEVATLIRDVASIIQPLVHKKSNRLDLRCPDNIGTMRADLTKLRQALFNLLSNASKFTEEGVITLEVVREPGREGDWLIFRVRDSGIGMTPEQLSKLFQAFTQADASTTRKYGGTGLGLVITRKFCEMMQGDINVESTPGEGTTFTIRLPATVMEPKARPKPIEVVVPAEPVPEPVATVLVIDDDPTVHDLMRRTLVKSGVRVESALGGEEGLKQARQLVPDAITLDVMMPGLDGWAVLSALKADPATQHIPVIMLTMLDDKNMGYALGAVDYLTKPVDRDQLATVVNKYRRLRGPGPVLVVEDDPHTRDMTVRMLIKDGWEVMQAENGKVALERLAEREPSLILLDLMMPQMDGFEFVREMRKNLEWRALPIVVVTAKDLTDDDRKRLNGHVEKILQKGAFGQAELLRELHDLLRRFVPAAVSPSTTAEPRPQMTPSHETR
jgi:PAS domain S-box-containing protein